MWLVKSSKSKRIIFMKLWLENGSFNWNLVSYFWLKFPFYTPWKNQITNRFLVFSGDIKNFGQKRAYQPAASMSKQSSKLRVLGGAISAERVKHNLTKNCRNIWETCAMISLFSQDTGLQKLYRYPLKTSGILMLTRGIKRD